MKETLGTRKLAVAALNRTLIGALPLLTGNFALVACEKKYNHASKRDSFGMSRHAAVALHKSFMVAFPTLLILLIGRPAAVALQKKKNDVMIKDSFGMWRLAVVALDI